MPPRDARLPRELRARLVAVFSWQQLTEAALRLDQQPMHVAGACAQLARGRCYCRAVDVMRDQSATARRGQLIERLRQMLAQLDQLKRRVRIVHRGKSRALQRKGQTSGVGAELPHAQLQRGRCSAPYPLSTIT